MGIVISIIVNVLKVAIVFIGVYIEYKLFDSMGYQAGLIAAMAANSIIIPFNNPYIGVGALVAAIIIESVITTSVDFVVYKQSKSFLDYLLKAFLIGLIVTFGFAWITGLLTAKNG